MTQHDWLTSDDPAAMLAHVQPTATELQLRAFVEACRERWLPEAINTQMLLPECASSWCGVLGEKIERAAILRDIFGNPWRPVHRNRLRGCTVCHDRGVTEKLELIGERPVLSDFAPSDDVKYRRVFPKCAACNVLIDPSWLTWNNGIVPKLVREIRGVCQACGGSGVVQYPAENEWMGSQSCSCHGKSRPDWSLMPILGDALEEAGCDNRDILEHCLGLETISEKKLAYSTYGMMWTAAGRPREEMVPKTIPLRGPHVQGCWVLELLGGGE